MTHTPLWITYRRSYDNMAKTLNVLQGRLRRCPRWDWLMIKGLERKIVLLKCIRRDMKRAMRTL